MEVEILSRNEVEREIVADSTTEFSDCITLYNKVQNEGTPQKKL